jgi:hypothetical protein
MWAKRAFTLRPHKFWWQLLLLTSFASWELRTLLANAQSLDCPSLLRISQTNLTALQPCVSSAVPGPPVVLDGSRRFQPPPGGSRSVLDMAYKQSTVLLLPSGKQILKCIRSPSRASYASRTVSVAAAPSSKAGAVTEIVSANVTGVRLAKPTAGVVVQLLAVSVQSAALLRLTDINLETDCATLIRFQQWIAEARPTNVTTVRHFGLLGLGGETRGQAVARM